MGIGSAKSWGRRHLMRNTTNANDAGKRKAMRKQQVRAKTRKRSPKNRLQISDLHVAWIAAKRRGETTLPFVDLKREREGK
jgi:hypothetical protein